MLDQDSGWGASRSWEPSDSGARWRQSDWDQGHTGTADAWRQPDRDAAPTWRPDRQQRFPRSAAEMSGGYEFRPDPSLEGGSRGQPQGWEFRPLSDRDRDRARTDERYAPIDERDYLPRGPWRSYEDEGTAFGYHGDELWRDRSMQPR